MGRGDRPGRRCVLVRRDEPHAHPLQQRDYGDLWPAAKTSISGGAGTPGGVAAPTGGQAFYVGLNGTIANAVGGTWTRRTSPTPSGGGGAYSDNYHDVCCAGPDDCRAVGNSGMHILWNGSLWTQDPAVALAGSPLIACAYYRAIDGFRRFVTGGYDGRLERYDENTTHSTPAQFPNTERINGLAGRATGVVIAVGCPCAGGPNCNFCGAGGVMYR